MILLKIKKSLEKVFGTQNTRTLESMRPLVEQVNSLESSLEKLTDEQLKQKTQEFKRRLADGQTLDDILVEAFAVVREVSKRTIKLRHYDVQILGGIVLHQGKIAEMSTGEGKTLVGTCPIYLNALMGRGVHVITVNDYLAQRDRDWMGPIYEFLGLTVGVIQHDVKPDKRREAYACDITFGTNNEFGFDYLRDNMVTSVSDRVQREHFFCIIDEVDSVLIDEARTPLIISGPAEESTDKYYKINRIMSKLDAQADYTVDEKAHTVTLTEAGIVHCEKLLNIDNIYENTQIDVIHHINQALRAHVLFRRDEAYVVKDDQVIIVDEFTGRLMPGRRFSDGLHQALEAKEGVKIERENQTLATITFQNYFRMYSKLAGMTGTAATEAVEFSKIYKLDVVVMPTNRPCIRKDLNDCIYRTEKEKFEAVVAAVIEEHKKGRPVLVGTISIEKSERLSHMLKRYNLPHTVLNAKFHEQEADIVSKAGQPATVTIATNMAGRGTDIVLGDGVAAGGGLAMIGTERHESRRIDNQLRGRCGRQGDPGSSRFFISLEDDLMRIFGSDRIGSLMQKMGMEEGEEIQHPMVNKAIETAQKRVEARNFEIRKHLLDFDDVMNRQRELIYKERDKALFQDGLREHILDFVEDIVEDFLARYMHPDMGVDDRDQKGLVDALNNKFGADFKETVEKVLSESHSLNIDWLREDILKKVKEKYELREQEFGSDRMRFLESYIMLQIIDSKWKEHLHGLDDLKEGINLRAYGQRDPIIEYKTEAFKMFQSMVDSIKEESIEFLFRVQSVKEEEVKSNIPSKGMAYIHPESESLGSQVSSSSQTSLLTGKGYDDTSTQATIKRDEPKVGRNDSCPCGSGKKYKKCCGKDA